MENLTIVGMKDLNLKLAKIERSLDRIAKALEDSAKIQNRKVSIPIHKSNIDLDPIDDEEDEDDEMQ